MTYFLKYLYIFLNEQRNVSYSEEAISPLQSQGWSSPLFSLLSCRNLLLPVIQCLACVRDAVLAESKSWSAQFSSVAQSCPTLWDFMDCSMPGISVHHHLPEFTQSRVR